jgi:hypothetical protein
MYGHGRINPIDTADVYGGPQSPDMEQGYGSSEEIIGRWLAEGGCRERIVLATKVYQPRGTGPNERRVSACHIRKACDDSLRRCYWRGRSRKEASNPDRLIEEGTLRPSSAWFANALTTEPIASVDPETKELIPEGRRREALEPDTCEVPSF